jgi:hypothetical protein
VGGVACDLVLWAIFEGMNFVYLGGRRVEVIQARLDLSCKLCFFSQT